MMASRPDFLRPDTIEAAVAFRRELGPSAAFGAGLTALQLAWDGPRPAGGIIDVSGLDLGPDWRREPDGRLVLAANARLQRLWRDPGLGRLLPVLVAAVGVLGSASVRNIATLGGNLLWGAGDLEVLFTALGGRLRFASGPWIALGEGTARPEGDMLVAADVPAVPAGEAFYEKLGHRHAFSPARVVVAGRREPAGWRLAARLAGTPVRGCLAAPGAEADAIAGLFPPESDPQLARVGRRLLAGHLARLDREARA